MKVGTEYLYNKIETFAEENEYSVDEMGYVNEIGARFVILKHLYKDLVISFVLVGGRSNQYVYRCAYSDVDAQ